MLHSYLITFRAEYSYFFHTTNSIPKLLSVKFSRHSKHFMCLLQRKTCKILIARSVTVLFTTLRKFTASTVIKILGSDNVYVGRNVLSF